MGFLHNFWDETLAGPAPDKLRKYDSLPAVRSPPPPLRLPGNNQFDDNSITVSRCITIVRSNSGTNPSSPVTPSTPSSSPFSPTTPRGDYRKLTRRKSAPESLEPGDMRNPAVYDWLVLNALDR